MSDIEKLVKELEDTHRIIKGLADNSMCNLYREANSIDEAISTIKELSANYEKSLADVVSLSTQDKWILCSERLPYDNDDILYTQYDEMFEDCHVDKCKGWWFKEHLTNMKAWMPLPEPYKGE